MGIEWATAVGDGARLRAAGRAAPAARTIEDALDALTELAVELVGLPRACVTIVDSEHTTAVSGVGIPEGAPRSVRIEQAFCRYVVGTSAPFVVDDARSDPRTIGDVTIRIFDAVSWAGFPLEDGDGEVVGTFCIMDSQPHAWTDRDLHILATLARAASSEIELGVVRAERAALTAYLDQLAGAGGERARLAEDLRARLAASLPATLS